MRRMEYHKLLEIFSEELLKNIIRVNHHIVNHRKEKFGCVLERLLNVFNKVNSFNEISDRRERIIKKTAHILGGLTWSQPFSNGNKRTALSISIYFLRKNGFDLPITNKGEEKELFDLLEKTVLKFEGDETIISEVEEYLLRKII